MQKKHGKKEYTPHIEPGTAPLCEAANCINKGVYKAPKSKNQLQDYHWLCLDHIKEYNQKWDYFNGMTTAEIEEFMQDAVTGHRPTWNRESRLREPASQLHDALYEFLAGTRKAKKTLPPLSSKLQKALAVMDMDYPFSQKILKDQYKKLVKKHHPDVNKGNKLSEEKFKKITESYHLLAAYLKSDLYKS